MRAAELSFVVKAIDQASGTLNSVNGQIDGAGRGVQEPERPDVEGSSGEIDATMRGGAHGGAGHDRVSGLRPGRNPYENPRKSVS